MKEHLLSGEIMYCKEGKCKGPVKPNIVFFGENLPEGFMRQFMKVTTADLLIVMGTSLYVGPFNSLVKIATDVPKVLVNRENTSDFHDFKDGNKKLDMFMAGDCDDSVQKIVDSCGWGEEFGKLLEERKELLMKVPEAKRKSKL
jgi:NAD-dependent SIR2 family protein deacetylase